MWCKIPEANHIKKLTYHNLPCVQNTTTIITFESINILYFYILYIYKYFLFVLSVNIKTNRHKVSYFTLTTQDSLQDTEIVVVSLSLLQRWMGKWKPHGESSREMWKHHCAKREKGSSAEIVKIVKLFFASGFSQNK